MKLWPFGNRDATFPDAEDLIGMRTAARASGRGHVSREQSLRNSVVWACLVLRADLISTMPLDVLKAAGTPAPKPPFFTRPSGGDFALWTDWCFATQFDLDSTGNCFGIIQSRDGRGIPNLIEPVRAESVRVRMVKGETRYVIGTTEYDAGDIWHERAHPVPGSPVGLSPIAAAALTLGNYLDAAEFAAAWFQNKAVPGGHLKNNAKVLKRREAQRVKDSFIASVKAGDVWVSGQDWDYSPVAAKASDAAFLEQIDATHSDVCRFLGVPGDMVDVGTKGQAITYANITQRNLQFLITKLGPAIVRREAAWTDRLLPRPWYAKLNTSAMLRMDPAARYAAYGVAIDKRFMAPSEARAFEDWAPMTPEQEAEFGRLFPAKAAGPTPGGPTP